VRLEAAQLLLLIRAAESKGSGFQLGSRLRRRPAIRTLARHAPPARRLATCPPMIRSKAPNSRLHLQPVNRLLG